MGEKRQKKGHFLQDDCLGLEKKRKRLGRLKELGCLKTSKREGWCLWSLEGEPMEPVSKAGGRMYACCLLQACDGSSPWLQFLVFCHSQNKAYHASYWQNLTGSHLSEENVGFGISTWVPQRRGVGWELGGRLKKQGIYVYLWLIHIALGRNQHNIIKQLSSN